METALKVGTSEKIAESFDKVKLGNYWTKGEHKRLYINNDVLFHLFDSKKISHNALYADPYIDIATGKWVSTPELTEEEYAALEIAFSEIVKEFGSKVNKESKSKWTGEIQTCRTVYHVIGNC